MNFEASLGYTAKPCLVNKNKQTTVLACSYPKKVTGRPFLWVAFSQNVNLKNYLAECVHVHVSTSVHVSSHSCEGKRTNFRSWLFPSTVDSQVQTQIIKLEHKYVQSAFTQAATLPALNFNTFISYSFLSFVVLALSLAILTSTIQNRILCSGVNKCSLSPKVQLLSYFGEHSHVDTLKPH